MVRKAVLEICVRRSCQADVDVRLKLNQALGNRKDDMTEKWKWHQGLRPGPMPAAVRYGNLRDLRNNVWLRLTYTVRP